MFKNRFSLRNVATIVACLAVCVFSSCDKENEPDNDDFIAVTGITDVSAVAEVGKPLTLTATVSPANATGQTIVWTVKNAGTTGASITGGNTLTVSAAGTVIVTAAIANGATRATPFAADFSISIKSAGDMPVVTGVTVSPSSASVAKGSSQAFTATVAGSKLDDAGKAVNWSVTGGTKAGTAISASGKLTVAADETAASLTVKATSVADNTKIGEATVTVTAAGKTGCYIGDTHYPYFDDAFAAAQGTTTIITVYSNPLTSGRTLSENTHITVEAGGSGERVFEIGSGGNFFTVKSGSSLVLKNITLDAGAKYKGSLISIEGGTFTMLEGTKIAGCVYNDGHGGGVFMNSGNFIMKGGSITGNSVPMVSTGIIRIAQGGGVYMSGGTFIMEGGEITGNTAEYVGGLYIYGGKFIMKGGRIYSNIANSTGSNNNLALYTGNGGTAVFGDGTPIPATGEDITGRN